MAASAQQTELDGVACVELAAGDYTSAFLPGLGMVGTSLRWRGDEHVHFDLAAYRSGHQSGIPLLHPWANRLARTTYETDGQWVDFDPIPPVRTHDALPMHGTMTGADGWVTEVVLADSSRALLQARYRFGEHADHLRSFPFPHELVVFAELSESGLRVTTTIHNTGVRPVPVSFGWHPYVVLPGVARVDLGLQLPDREHLELDGRKLPTGESRHEAAGYVPLGNGEREVTFDDSYRLAGSNVDGGHELSLEGAEPDGGWRRLTMSMDAGYPYAQLYAPSLATQVAIEPMTAPVNALVTGDHRSVPPGEQWAASFAVRVEVVDADRADEHERTHR